MPRYSRYPGAALKRIFVFSIYLGAGLNQVNTVHSVLKSQEINKCSTAFAVYMNSRLQVTVGHWTIIIIVL